MAVEIRAGLSRGESRRLRRDPETVYTDLNGTREFRVAVVRSGEYPHPTSLVVNRFDYQNGQWRVGSEGGRFTDTDRSRRSIEIMAQQRGCTRRRV